MARATKKSQQKQGTLALQATGEMPANVSRGFRRPTKKLDEVLQLIKRVLPPEVEARAVDFNVGSLGRRKPTAAEVERGFSKYLSTLSGPLESHLREHYMTRLGRPTEKMRATLAYYHTLRDWRESLRIIARRGGYLRISRVAEIDWNTGKLKNARNPFESALDDNDLRSVRECSICGQIYFAGRLTYKGKEIEPRCSVECGKKIRDSRYQPNKERYGQNRALKEATKERKTKRTDPNV